MPWNVTHSSSPKFTEREEILQKMDQALFPETTLDAAASRRAFVLDGSGKTQIYCRFCEKHRESSVFLVHLKVSVGVVLIVADFGECSGSTWETKIHRSQLPRHHPFP